MTHLLQGFAIGFSLAAPVGPIGLLCFRRSLADGCTAGFVSGLGAATADALYGTVAALGLWAIMHVLLAQQTRLQLSGLRGLHRASGLKIAGFGVWQLAALLRSLR